MDRGGEEMSKGGEGDTGFPRPRTAYARPWGRMAPELGGTTGLGPQGPKEAAMS